MSSNILANIEKDAFRGLGSLKTLDLSFNNLKDLGLVLSDEIEYLSIASNQLKYWPLANLPKNLKSLELQDNQLIEIFNIASMSRNSIEFTSLLTFDISQNQIEHLPSGIFYPKLQEFDASYNLFASIPQYLGAQAPEMSVFRFRGNPVRKIEFSTKFSARILDLSDSPLITDLDASQFNWLGM